MITSSNCYKPAVFAVVHKFQLLQTQCLLWFTLNYVNLSDAAVLSRCAVTLCCHAVLSWCCHAVLSRCVVMLWYHAVLSRCAVTLCCHAVLSRCVITLCCHTVLSCCVVTLCCHSMEFTAAFCVLVFAAICVTLCSTTCIVTCPICSHALRPKIACPWTSAT